MSSSTKLSPMASYYVRRLLQLQKDAVKRSGADAALLADLQLDPEELIERLALSSTERSQQVNSLEILARAYQSLVTDGTHANEANEIGKQILSTLGLNNLSLSVSVSADGQPALRKDLTVGQGLEILQSILGNGEKYLGPRIAKENLVAARPTNLPPDDFVLNEGERLRVSRPGTTILSPEEFEALRSWVKAYNHKCSEIVHSFYKFFDRKVLDDLALSPQDFRRADDIASQE
jgi:hypothetical protein